MKTQAITRRSALKLVGSGITALTLSPASAFGQEAQAVTKKIPSSGEALPVIGMGTWRTFNVGRDPVLRGGCAEVLKAFFDHGGGVLDCSPMYGSAREVIGHALKKTGIPKTLFSAEKIFTEDGSKTREQTKESAALWGVGRLDLMQVHNLVAWQQHLPALVEMKKEGLVRYIGITTSHGRRHEDMEKLMKGGGLDFIQLTYNLRHREVEQRLLPLAADKGIAVIANRPLDGGALVTGLLQKKAPLPEWAAEFDCKTWAAFMLKFVVSHPAVNCAIPATTKVAHLTENMAAGRGRMPNAETRQRMIQHVEKL